MVGGGGRCPLPFRMELALIASLPSCQVSAVQVAGRMRIGIMQAGDRDRRVWFIGESSLLPLFSRLPRGNVCFKMFPPASPLLIGLHV